MTLSHNKDLYDELFLKIARMHDEVDYRRHLNEYKGQGGNWKDYPAVSVGAEIDIATGIGHHHNPSRQQDFHPLIFNGLTLRLGDLNTNSTNYPACKNLVGHCAENYAASKALSRIDPDGQANDMDLLSDFKFTKAFRPRTWKNIDWCKNCHTMFD